MNTSRMNRLLPRRLAVLSPLLAPVLALAACQSTATEPEESYIRTRDGTLLHYAKMGEGPDVLLVPEEAWVVHDMGPRNNCFSTAQGKVRDLKGELGLKGSFIAFLYWFGTPFPLDEVDLSAVGSN